MIQLEARSQGVLLPVRATAGARRNTVGGEHGGALKVSVTQVAEKGKANKAIIAALSKSLGIAKSRMELVSGATSRDKQFLLVDASVDEVREAVANLV